MREAISFERTTKPASDFAIEQAADDIFAILKEFDSPKDASPALALAHYKMIVACFPPSYRAEAFEALDSYVQSIKELLSDDWQ